MKIMKIDKLGNEHLEDFFRKDFENIIAETNDISEFECRVVKRTSEELCVEVTVFGIAGSPDISSFKNGKVNGASVFKMGDEINGYLNFKLDTSDSGIFYLNGNDYVITYKSNLK